jgi:hypothetical protein
VLAGDVNYSAGSIENRNGNTVDLVIDEIELIKGETYEVPIYLSKSEKISGLQFELKFNGLAIEHVSSEVLDIKASNYKINSNGMRLSWNTSSDININNDEPIMYITLIANENGQLLKSLEINSTDFRAEMYYENEISELKMKFRNILGLFALHQNIPNPFSDKTFIGFDLPEENSYTLSIYDITGRIIKEISDKGKEGYNSVNISRKELGRNGVFYYRLKSGDNTDSRKMILIK